MVVSFCFFFYFGAFFLNHEDLKPGFNPATEIISADGVVLGKYFQKTDPQLKYSDLPKI
jgi:penicillin-binding protein 1A